MSKWEAAGIVLAVCAVAFGLDALFDGDSAVFAIAATALYAAVRGHRLGD